MSEKKEKPKKEQTELQKLYNEKRQAKGEARDAIHEKIRVLQKQVNDALEAKYGVNKNVLKFSTKNDLTKKLKDGMKPNASDKRIIVELQHAVLDKAMALINEGKHLAEVNVSEVAKKRLDKKVEAIKNNPKLLEALKSQLS